MSPTHAYSAVVPGASNWVFQPKPKMPSPGAELRNQELGQPIMRARNACHARDALIVLWPSSIRPARPRSSMPR